jgi:hypothetical protein
VRARRLVLLALAAGSLAALAAVAAVLLLRGDDSTPAATPRTLGLARCDALLEARRPECYTRELQLAVVGADDVHAALARVNRTVRARGGRLLSDCHGFMHTVGRRYVQEHDVTVASLMDVLPRTNDPGCPAGFAHGLVTGVAPQIDPRDPRSAAAVCGRSATRFQRYSCTHGFGHAFMRIYDDRLGPALELCRALGPNTAPDCAQGAFHDYWFAVIGADDAPRPPDIVTDPRELCGRQRDEFVRPCWYRTFVDTRPPGFQTGSPAEIEALCAGLAGVQRAGCVTAASVIGPPDPAVQLELCAGIAQPVDQVSCIHGTKVQNVLNSPVDTYLAIIARCELFAGPTRAACYAWLGKTLAVITDGEFERTGCPGVASAAAQRACVEGARSMDEPLETFS